MNLKFPKILAALLTLSALPFCDAATYYLHPGSGDDANDGTRPESPFRTLERVNAIRLQAGDRVLLAAGQKFEGQLTWEGVAGSAARPIVISSYGAENGAAESRASIDAGGRVAGVWLRNCGHFVIENLQITADAGGMKSAPRGAMAMRCGVLVEAERPGEYEGFKISNMVVKDVFFEKSGFVRPANEVKSANGTQKYGWGIRFMVNSPKVVMRDIAITDCRIANVSHTGLKFTGPRKSLQRVDVRRIKVENAGGPGVQMSGVHGGHFSELDVNRSGSTDDTRKWGRGSGLWTWGTSDVLIEKSRFQNANGPGDSAGVHIDYHCRNVIVQYNLSAHNAGGFCEILGNNFNCAYRYNVSVNDGHRIKGRNAAFQEGKIFWLSGYSGRKKPFEGPFNSYFYNNTIFVGNHLTAKVSVAPSSRGVLVANNIFCFQGSSKAVPGDQEQRATQRGASPGNVVFENNLFLHRDNWPAGSSIQDKSPIVGDPEFAHGGGLEIADYLPRKIGLVRDKGIRISRIPGDEIGLLGGLELKTDILGNPIRNQPDLGAIEVPGS